MTPSPLTIREMAPEDRAAVERIYKAHVSDSRMGLKALRARIDELLQPTHKSGHAGNAVALVGIGARGRVVGYLVGEVRSWEFGSEPSGWIFAVGVDPGVVRQGLGRQLLDAAVARFHARGIRTVRTMVRKDDVPVLRFFRSGHFTAGAYVELELNHDD